MTKLSKYVFVILLSLAVLTACKVTKSYQSPSVTDNLFRGTDKADTTTIASLSWREMFIDTILQRLIEKGIEQNIDLQIAYVRVRQAQAYYKQSRAAFVPTINANADITRLRFSDAQAFRVRSDATLYQLGLTSAWEIDIWGRLNSIKKAKLANLLKTEAAAKTVQASIVSSIASLYYILLALDQQLFITEQTVRNWDTTVSTIRALKESARVTEAAVVQSEAQRYAAEVTIPDLKQRIIEIENAMSIVLGTPPTAINRNRLDEQSIISILSTGIPVQLLANRPDVSEAEAAYRYAFEITNVARTSFYPTLTIKGGTGVSSFNLGSFFNSSAFAANIGAGLTQPIFNRRLNKTNLLVAKEQQLSSLLSFKNTLLIAGREVADALSLHSTAFEKMLVRRKEINALKLSVDYTNELLKNGFANYTEVITARQSLLAAELGRVNDKLQQLQAVVSLYTALGGGWR